VKLTRRQSRILIAAGVWTLYVWISRLVIMSGQHNSFGFNLVHGILAAVSIAFGLAVGRIGWSARSAKTRNGSAQHAPLPESWNDEPATGMKLKS
jgi:hypothetical protein